MTEAQQRELQVRLRETRLLLREVAVAINHGNLPVASDYSVLAARSSALLSERVSEVKEEIANAC